MKTLFYSVVMILLWGCTKQENFSEQSIPEIGSEHNKILDEILKEIHQKTFEDWIDLKEQIYLKIVQKSYQESGLNRWVTVDYIQQTRSGQYFNWMKREGFEDWVRSLDDVKIRNELMEIGMYLLGEKHSISAEDYFNKIDHLENGQIIQQAFRDTYKHSSEFWKNRFHQNVGFNKRVYVSDPEIPWQKLAIWDAVGAVKGAIEFGRIGVMLGGFWGGLVVGATGAIFEGATASAAAYLEDQLEKLIIR